MIQLSGVTHHFGKQPVLLNLDFQVEKGEVIAVLGPNGMGKTTLLKLMAGALSQERGSVKVHGLERRSSVENEIAIRSKTVFLPDEAWIPSISTIREHVLSVAELYDRDMLDAMDHADRLFDLFSLKDKADSSISSCSTGQRKKAALCTALITNAPLMLMDEPFSGGLDPGGIVALKHVLKRMSKHADDGLDYTVVFTTPVPEIIEDVADKIAIIQDQSVTAFGTPAELCEQVGKPSLEEALGSLMHSDTLDRVNRYFVAG